VKFLHAGITLAFCIGALLATSAVRAAPFLPPGISDEVYINGQLAGSAPEGQENGIFDTNILVSSTLNLNAVLLLEPDTGGISDIAWVGLVSDAYHILLVSDNSSGGFPSGTPSIASLTVVGSLTETGDLQDIGTYFGLQAGVLQVASGSAETPIPAALPLFASGAGLIGLFARRKKQKRVA
jgi:hypothetical protein